MENKETQAMEVHITDKQLPGVSESYIWMNSSVCIAMVTHLAAQFIVKLFQEIRFYLRVYFPVWMIQFSQMCLEWK